jgi:hypothetical protein
MNKYGRNILIYSPFNPCLNWRVGESFPQLIVVGVRDVEESHPSRPQVLNGFDDVERPEQRIFTKF